MLYHTVVWQYLPEDGPGRAQRRARNGRRRSDGRNPARLVPLRKRQRRQWRRRADAADPLARRRDARARPRRFPWPLGPVGIGASRRSRAATIPVLWGRSTDRFHQPELPMRLRPIRPPFLRVSRRRRSDRFFLPPVRAARRRSRPSPARDANMSGSFVLALSWEPAFCETQPRVPECRSQTADSVDAKQFSLHGLWPRDELLRRRHQNARGRRGAIAGRTASHRTAGGPRAALDIAMPGTQSQLDRHEWIKHGTCAGVDQATYFAAALALTERSMPRPCRPCSPPTWAIPCRPPDRRGRSTRISAPKPASA